MTPLKRLSSWTLNSIDFIIADSYAVKKVIEGLVKKKENLAVIPPGILLKQFSPLIKYRP